MPQTPVRVRLLVGGVLGLVTLTWSLAGQRAQQRVRAADKPLQAGPTRSFTGVALCARCHRQPEKGSSPVLCRCIEVQIWEKDDKHKDAFNKLDPRKYPRAKRMGELLGINDVSREPSCLNCHGVNYHARDFKKGLDFKVEDGVSCVVCHGPYKEWVDKHGGTDILEWRKKKRSEKEAVWGMTDLWDPARRTRLCASCHIGNKAEGKVVTHAMYAAGHPPLPGFEVAAFSDQMPRHWQYIKEKTPAVQKLLEFDEPAEARYEQTKLVVVSGVVSLREVMNLLAAQAGAAAKEKGARRTWPELAQFDCYACHHDLQPRSWRQVRGYAGRPGRPQPRRWPTVLARLSLRHLGAGEKGFDHKMKALHQAFSVRPFGEAQDVSRAARGVADWCQGLTQRLEKVRFDRPAVIRLLRHLCSLARTEVPDYDSARQMAWAFEIIYRELYWSPDNKSVGDPRIRGLLKEQRARLKLNLPAGQKGNITEELSARLKTLNEYDPAQFQRTMAKLAKLLPTR